jgi:hypothetical protein
LLSLLLVVAIGLVLTKTYWLWTSGPWGLPNAKRTRSLIVNEDVKAISNSRPAIGTETIVSKNIFDPERGAGFTRQAETNSQAYQRIQGMILLGTAILGNDRFAILQDGGVSPGAAAASGQSLAPMRIKLGDTVEGFKLSEISEKRIVFARGSATVELPLDYFRKTDIAQPRRPSAAQTSPAGQAPAPRVLTPRQASVPRQRLPRATPTLSRERKSAEELAEDELKGR